jgi:hypothetical protein
MDEAQKKERIATVVKWGLAILAIAIVSPIIILAVKGLVGIAIAVVVGLAIINLAPVVAMKFANLKMKGIVDEANENPIETMENLRIEKAKEADEADRQMVEFETEISNFDDERRQFEKEYPDESHAYREISTKMHLALSHMKREQDGVREKLEDLDGRIRKARAIYKMSLAAQTVTSLSKNAEKAVFQDIKEKVAFDSVRTELNRSVASLNLALRQRTVVERPALPHPSVHAEFPEDVLGPNRKSLAAKEKK